MSKISSKNQVTLPVAALEEAGLHRGDEITVQATGHGELRISKNTMTFEEAFGSLTGTYPPGYLAQLDAEEEERG